ncbi:MAG: hypothetical protein JWN23_2940 [Rhodocyclales bacterium]|nr:hypothetical protein [Rhodocyclales bacterium]
MPASSLPIWRLLGWGLLASLILHWIALDLMRAAALPHVPGSRTLRVSLGEVGRDALRMAPMLDTPVASVARAIKSAEPIHAQAEPATVGKSISPMVPRGQITTVLPTEGLRSGQPAEAMVALRLALAGALGTSLPSNMPKALTLWCDFDAAGHLLDVHGEGIVDAVLLASVKRTASQLVVPDSLAGRPFSLDVLLERID